MRNDEGHQVSFKARDNVIGCFYSAHARISETRLIQKKKYGVL